MITLRLDKGYHQECLTRPERTGERAMQRHADDGSRRREHVRKHEKHLVAEIEGGNDKRMREKDEPIDARTSKTSVSQIHD